MQLKATDKSGICEDKAMRKYHVISAKRMGWDNGDRTYEHFFFQSMNTEKKKQLLSFAQFKRYIEK